MSASQRGPAADGASTPDGRSGARWARRAVLLLRGVGAATTLGVYTVAGGIGALLALLPAALEPPRDRAALRPAAPHAPPAPPAGASREPMPG